MPGTIDSRAKEIFGQALDLAGPERGRFLESACAGDASLLARVRTLLEGAERSDHFLADPPVGPRPPAPSPVVRVPSSREPASHIVPGPPGPPGPSGPAHTAPERGNGDPASAPIAEAPGATIGRYRLLQMIGEGGFGSVFVAEQKVPVQRRVAFKVLKLGMDTRAVVARFEQERQALALMDHPNIAKVLDAGATTTGRPYFVMELVRGDPITTFCDRETLPIAGRLGLFSQVCRAVQHAHTKGIIHRDIKPSNVLASVQDGKPTAKVIDFGIAKAIDRPLTDKTIFTEFRQMIGTPEYMSPEQAAASLDIDTRTDVYSLGVLLYELLTGSPPFDPTKMRSGAIDEIQRIIREVEPPRPSTRLSKANGTLAGIAARRAIQPGRLGALIRGELDWIVMRTLEKDRSRRYESPGALADDIERYLSGQAVVAAPPSTAYRVRTFVRRHRVGVTAGALVAAALIVGTAGTTVGLVRAISAEAEAHAKETLANANAVKAANEAARADREAADARTSARIAESVNALLTTMIERADRGKQGGRADITVREVMDAAARQLTEQPGSVEPAVAAAMARTIGETYRELNLLDRAETMLTLAANGQQAVHGPQSVEYGGALNDLGAVIKARGRLEEAAAMYARSATILEALGEPAYVQLCTLRLNTAALEADLDHPAQAERILQEAITGLESRSLTGESVYNTALVNLAAVQYSKGDLDGAERTFRRTIESRQAAGGAPTPESVIALNNLAVIQFGRRQDEAAEATVREEIAAARALYGERHLQVADAHRILAIILGRRGDREGAVAAQRQTLDIDREILGAEHATTGLAAMTLGSMLMDKEPPDDVEAEPLVAAGLAVLRAKVGPGHPDTIQGNYRLGMILERKPGGAGLADAEALLRPAVEAATASLPEGDRFEWMRHSLSTLLGAVLVDRAAASPASAGTLLREAEPLVGQAADRLLTITAGPGARIGPATRKLHVTAACRRAVALYEALNALEPTPEHAAALELWRERLATETGDPQAGR